MYFFILCYALEAFTLLSAIPHGVGIAGLEPSPLGSTYFLATAQESKQKNRTLLKFLTVKNGLVYGRQPRCRYKFVPLISTRMASRA